MTTVRSKVLLASLLVGVLSIGVFLVHQWRVEQERTARQAELRVRTQAGLAAVSACEQDPLACQRKQAQGPARQAQLAPRETTATEGDDSRTPDVATREGAADQEIARARTRLHYRRLYGQLIQDLSLDERQADALIDLMILRSTEAISANDQNIQTDVLALKSEAMIQEVAALLGYEKGVLFQNYMETLGEQVRMSEIATQLYAAGLPLTANQRKDFLNVLLREKSQLPPPSLTGLSEQARLEAFVKWQIEFNRQVLADTQSLLSTDQTKYLADYLKSLAITQQAMIDALAEGAVRGDAQTPRLLPVN